MAVFPTCVGVFLLCQQYTDLKGGLPHVRGGVSVLRVTGLLVPTSSPRAWGCFSPRVPCRLPVIVFPTCVGVFPWHGEPLAAAFCLPHVRGGVSKPFVGFYTTKRSSPRAWGCFLDDIPELLPFSVFPTCVGVFPERTFVSEPSPSLPHVRGGVSHRVSQQGAHGGSSPRAWGCFSNILPRLREKFVFPTCVGVFPKSRSN